MTTSPEVILRTDTDTDLPFIVCDSLLKRLAASLSQSSGVSADSSVAAAISMFMLPVPLTIMGKVSISARLSASEVSSE